MFPTDCRASASSTSLQTTRYAEGFSLVELLIIIGVLILLGVLLFPAFNAARKKTQQTNCVTNLQQLSHALTLYTADYDGAYPLMVTGTIVNHQAADEAQGWGELLRPYLRQNAFPVCPLRQWLDTLPERAKTMSDFSGYAVNARLNRSVGTRSTYYQVGHNEATFAYPACTLTLLEARVGIFELHRPDMIHSGEELNNVAGYRLDASQVDALLKQTPGALRHQGGANNAFADGHVKWFKPEQLHTDKKSDGVNPGFGL